MYLGAKSKPVFKYLKEVLYFASYCKVLSLHHALWNLHSVYSPTTALFIKLEEV